MRVPADELLMRDMRAEVRLAAALPISDGGGGEGGGGGGGGSEALAMWNTAGMQSGGEATEASIRRRTFLGGQLRSLPPTYVALSEVNGSRAAYSAEGGMRSWLLGLGYESEMVAGILGSDGRHRGGVLLAWRDVEVVSPPAADSTGVVLVGTFRARGHAQGATVEVGVVYGRHRKGGSLRAVRVVAHMAVGVNSDGTRRGMVAAGDYNATPALSFQVATRLRGQPDEELGGLVGGDGDGAGDSPPTEASLVPLGHDHTRGEFSRSRWRPTGRSQVREGTATIDHVVVAGSERGQWRLQARMFAETDGRLVSDHEYFVVVRDARGSQARGGGAQQEGVEWRPPRHKHGAWGKAARQEFHDKAGEAFDAACDCSVPAGDREGARRWNAIANVINASADAVTAGRQARMTLRESSDAAQAAALRQRVGSAKGLLRKLSDRQRAAAKAEAVAPPRGRAASKRRLAVIRARDDLFDPRAGEYLARNDRSMAASLAKVGAVPRQGLAPAAAVLMVERAETRLRQRLHYYWSRLQAVQRTESRELAAGLKAANATEDPVARREAVFRVMGMGAAPGGGIDGFHEHDDPARRWVSDPAEQRDGAGLIFRAIDDENYDGGADLQRAEGYLRAVVPRYAEDRAPDGTEWTLRKAMGNLSAFDATLRRLRPNKVTTLDRVAKELFEWLPERVRLALLESHLMIAEDEDGSPPSSWERIVVKLLDKKKKEAQLILKRDVCFLSQGLKTHTGLYAPAYEAPTARVQDAQHGWRRGEAFTEVAGVGTLSIDQAHLLRHLMIHLFCDIKRFFPAMDRGFVLLAELWHGLPKAVREETARLYSRAVAQYETVHGLATLNFTLLQMKSGAVQGCLLSTEKAKLFMNTLAEAVSMQIDGVRFWNGEEGGGVRMPQAILADDVLGMLTSWRALDRFLSICREWAEVTRSKFGVKAFTKTAFSAVEIDAAGRPREAVMPAGINLSIDDSAPPAPRMLIVDVYAHVGFRRRLDGQQGPQYTQLTSLNMAWLARVARVRRMSRREFVEYTNVGFEALAGVYCCWLPMDIERGEACGERARRAAYVKRFRPLQPTRADYYMPAPWQRTKQHGEGVAHMATARMAGEGLHHLTAIGDATLYTTFANAIADGVPSPIRTAVRSAVDLTAYTWGMCGEGYDTWECEHLEPVLALPRGEGAAGGYRNASEAFIRQGIRMRRAMARPTLPGCDDDAPSYNLRFVHQPAAGDPMRPQAAHHEWRTADRMELWRGELASAACKAAVGHPRLPPLSLLSAGVVVRAHLCRPRGRPQYMEYARAVQLIPDLREGDAEAEAAWRLVVDDLELLGVPPVAGEPTRSARAIWWGERHGWGEQHDGGARGGDHAWLDTLEARRAAGEDVSASEWAGCYTRWLEGEEPRAAQEPAPGVLATTAELSGGAHITSVMPPRRPKGAAKRSRQERPARTTGDAAAPVVVPPPIALWDERVETGGAAPVPTQEDAEALQRYARQRWEFTADGRYLTCAAGTDARDASVVVQLCASAMPIVIAAHLRAVEARAKREVGRRAAASSKGELEPAPLPPTAEELANHGGPGYHVALAQRTMDAMLHAEQLQGYPWTMAAAGDGTWKPEEEGGYGNGLGRGSLLHDGRQLGGEMEGQNEAGVMQLYGGRRHNFDTELAARIDVLDVASVSSEFGLHERLLYIYDSTSPMQASASFRRQHTRARMKKEGDDMLGSAMVLEDELEAATYWWLKSHRGHLLSAAPDIIADCFTANGGKGEYVPVPSRPSRHRSAVFYAKRSERDLALEVACHWVAEQLVEREVAQRAARRAAALHPGDARDDPVRASASTEVDVLRWGVRLDERDHRTLMELRWDRFDVMHSAGARSTSLPNSLGRWLQDVQCPCGLGRQTREHVLWDCGLCSAERAGLEAPLLELSRSMGKLYTVSGTHEGATACWREVAYPTEGGPGGDRGVCCTRLLLGVVRHPYDKDSRLAAALKPMAAVLRAVAGMARQVRSSTARTVLDANSARVRWIAKRAALRRWLAVCEVRGTWRRRGAMPCGDAYARARAREAVPRAQVRSALRWWHADCAAGRVLEAVVAADIEAGAERRLARLSGRGAGAHPWGPPRWRADFRAAVRRATGGGAPAGGMQAGEVTWRRLRAVTRVQVAQEELLAAVRAARSASARAVRARAWAEGHPERVVAGAAARRRTRPPAEDDVERRVREARMRAGARRATPRPTAAGVRGVGGTAAAGSAVTLDARRAQAGARKRGREERAGGGGDAQQRRVVRALFADAAPGGRGGGGTL